MSYDVIGFTIEQLEEYDRLKERNMNIEEIRRQIACHIADTLYIYKQDDLLQEWIARTSTKH